MKTNTSIKLKAAFLIIVFALNTVVGFACSIGMNMGFNSKHHHDEDATEAVVHVHKDGKEHVHQEKKESHNHDKSHRHDDANNHSTSGSDKDNCCNDKAIQFQQVDKSLSHAATLTLKAPVFIAFMSAFYGLEIKTGRLVSVTKFLIPQFYPPPDIRIAIQSFQI